jgi:peptide/nickel transport system permease protein
MRRGLRLNAALGGAVVAAVVLGATLGPLLVPSDPLAVNLRARLGARTSLAIAVTTTALAVALGSLIGLVAGHFRGWVDRALMVANDALLAFPGLLLALGFMAVFGASRSGIVIALGIAYAPVVARVVRGAVLSLREREFVEASRVIGNPEWLTLMRHVAPNCVAPVLVLATMMTGWVVLSESALSFLGLGVPPPAPSWGNMLSTGRPWLAQAPHLILLPGLCIAVTLLGVNLLGDALRDRLDPRMRP